MHDTITHKRAKSINAVVVDDDDVSRRGMVSLLGEHGQVASVTPLSHNQALCWPGDWNSVDVVVVDASDEQCGFDQFPGVGVVERVRSHTALGQTTVIVMTEQFLHDGLRRRMREARADFFYPRSELGNTDILYAAVLRPTTARRGIPPTQDPEAEFRLGVTVATRVNRAVTYAVESGLSLDLARRREPRSRRWIRLRAEFNSHARLTPVTIDGRRPDRTQELPSLPQMARFLTWATKVKPSAQFGVWDASGESWNEGSSKIRFGLQSSR